MKPTGNVTHCDILAVLMALTPGIRLGPYEILASIGAGGMGEVYRARDTRLDRTVAIKVLPSHLSGDAGVKARFEREARAISSLSHPNICTLHDIGSQDGIDYLVMEYLEGESLASRLEKGPLPQDELLRCAVQIADGLEKAHRQGLAHRDLKPGNIMLTKSGAKLLDFGLARAMGLSEAPGALTSAPTMHTPLTAVGAIVGTFQYLAPEQLEGKEADARSDIFSLGAVLYEMATAKRAFTGRTQASVIGSILRDQPPPISTVQPLLPAGLDRVVKQCLAKDPDDRWQSAGDLKRELIWIQESGLMASSTGIAIPAAPPKRKSAWLGWAGGAAAAVFLVATLILVMTRAGVTPEPARPLRVSILPEPGTTLIPTSFHAGPVTIAPDGTKLVFTVQAGEGQPQLWVRSLAEPAAKVLAGTEWGTRPFWSPDSRHIGFFAHGKVKKITSDGGPVIELTDAVDARGGSWNKEGVIIFTPNFSGPIVRISAEGGPVTPVTQLDVARDEITHRYPSFLPDGRHFLYLARTSGGGAGKAPRIMLGSLDSMERKPLLEVASNAVYASGHLLYTHQKSLMARPFDPEGLTFTGEAFPLIGDLMMDERFSLGVFSASTNGVLAFQTGTARTISRMEWRDRAGIALGSVGEAEAYYDSTALKLSPDGSKVLVSVLDSRTGLSDLWALDVARGLRTRFTLEPGDEVDGVWSPDGASIIYGASEGPRGGFLYRKRVDGTGAPEKLSSVPSENFIAPLDWSANGRFVLYTSYDVSGRPHIFALPLEGERKPLPIGRAPYTKINASFSPDNRFVAWSSDEAGRTEVYVAPFPGLSGRVQVSSNGGSEPLWRGDGREMYYFAPDNRLMAVEVLTDGVSFGTGNVTPLFSARDWGTGYRYEVTTDGQRFLVLVPVPDESPSSISLAVNWAPGS